MSQNRAKCLFPTRELFVSTFFTKGRKLERSEFTLTRQSYLYSSVAAEVKIKLIWMRNVCIYSCSSWNIATSSNLNKKFVKNSAANNCLYTSTLIKNTGLHLKHAAFQRKNCLSTVWNVSIQ